jgi:hypothetical protein
MGTREQGALPLSREPVPEPGRSYDYYDDGKVRPGRKDRCTVTAVTPFATAPGEVRHAWEQEKIGCPHLYAGATDFFVRGTLSDAGETVWFARCAQGGWFGFGNYMYDGRLDVDGRLGV